LGCQKIGKNSIDNICPAVWDRLIQKHEEKFSFFGRKSEGKRGVAEPGGKGEVTFSLKPRRGCSLAPPFPLFPPAGDSPAAADFLFATFSFWGGVLLMHRRKGKPEESKTVRQWGLLGRIPIDALKPSYIWETQTDGPVTVYYHEENTREMTESEEAAFLADIKGYGQRYLQMIIQERARLRRGGEDKA
jgi:hypothetical protein